MTSIVRKDDEKYTHDVSLSQSSASINTIATNARFGSISLLVSQSSPVESLRGDYFAKGVYMDDLFDGLSHRIECIGDDVRINGGSHLENTDQPLYTIKDGIVVVKKGAIIPNGFVI